MWKDLENQTIGLGFNNDRIENNYDFYIHILQADDGTISSFLRLQKQTQWLVFGICWLIILVGLYFRHILFTFLFEQYKLKELTPINVLIIVASTIQYVAIIFSTLSGTIIVWNDSTLENIGPWLWVTTKLLVSFDIYYSYIAGLGLSTFRILYIKHNYWVKYKIGERSLLNIILFGGLFVAAFLVLLLNIDAYAEILNELCVSPRSMILQILDEYEQSRGNTSIYSYWRNVRIIVALVIISMTITEITMYFIFFYQLYQHDNQERLRRLLGPKVIKLRNRTNAITFFGQFCSFTFEISVGIALIYAHMGRAPFIVTYFLRVSCFTTMSVVEVLTSNSLRPRIFKH